MKSWAIIVGINQYPANAGQTVLNGAVADAIDFADWALHPSGGAVPPERLFLWTHPKAVAVPASVAAYLAKAAANRWWDEDAADPAGTPADFARAPKERPVIETALRAGAEAAEDVFNNPADQSPRRCYVFFAGHGVQTNVTGSTTDTQTCYVVGDFRPTASTVRGLIPCEDFKRALLNAGFDQVFMFLDCCRVSLTKLNMPAPVIGSPNTRLPPAPIWGVGSAAQKDKPAFETVGPPVRGAFSQTLLQGLRTVRDPVTQTLSLESLKLYVRDNIGAACLPNEQKPSFTGDPNEPLPALLVGPVIPAPVLLADINIDFGAVAAGTVVQLVDDQGVAVGAPLIAGPGGAVVQAPIGQFYSLDIAIPPRSTAFRHAGPGATDVTL